MSSFDINWKELDLKRFYVFSGVTLFGVRAFLYPITLVKTHLQVTYGQRKPVREVIAEVYKRGRLRGFWKGFMTFSVGLVPSQVLYLSTLELVKQETGKVWDFFELGEAYKSQAKFFVGGAMASVVAQFATVPIDVVTQRLQIQGASSSVHRYRGGIDAFRQIRLQDGLRGFWRGYWASVLTYGPFSAIWWLTYSMVKPVMYRFFGVHERTQGLYSLKDMVLQGSCGAICALVGVIATNPMDVVKTRMQTKSGSSHAAHGGFLENASGLWREEGLLSLYKGVSMRFLSSLSFSILSIMTYEFVKRVSHKDYPLWENIARLSDKL